MNSAQTYHLGRRAHDKLNAQTSHTDHNLRIIVGHVNLLDFISVHLERERQQQISTSRSLSKNTTSRPEPHRPSLAIHQETVVKVEELPLSDDEDSDNDSDGSDSSDDCDKVELHEASVQTITLPLRETHAALQRRKQPVHVSFFTHDSLSDESDESDEEALDSDEDDDGEIGIDFELMRLDSSPLARQLSQANKFRDVVDTSLDTLNGLQPFAASH